MDQQSINQYLDFYRNGLFNNVLPFWLSHGVDDASGGVFGSLDQDGTLIDTDKSVWQQGRFAWLLGELFNHPEWGARPDSQHWKSVAERTLDFISRHCFDVEDGRMWFQVTGDGQPIRKRRYSFSESFAALAYGEWAKATGNEEYAAQAERCLEQFLQQNRCPDAPPKFTDARPVKGIGFPMITINVAQQLRDSIGLENANALIDEAISEIRNDFLKPELECVMETVGPSGQLIDHFDGRTLNPGHAIEAAWFIMQEGVCRDGNQDLIQLGCQILRWMWKRGWDREYGGLLYFTSVDDRPIQEYWQEMKFWWPHNELIIASLLAFQLTGEAEFEIIFRQSHEWAHDHFADPEHGEWFGYLRRDGTVSNRLKGNLWKGPFHLPRMQLISLDLLDKLSRDGSPNA